MAGLLTYSSLKRPSHSYTNSGLSFVQRFKLELTAAGLFRIFT